MCGVARSTTLLPRPLLVSSAMLAVLACGRLTHAWGGCAACVTLIWLRLCTSTLTTRPVHHGPVYSDTHGHAEPHNGLPPHSSMGWCGGSLLSCEETLGLAAKSDSYLLTGHSHYDSPAGFDGPLRASESSALWYSRLRLVLVVVHNGVLATTVTFWVRFLRFGF